MALQLGLAIFSLESSDGQTSDVKMYCITRLGDCNIVEKTHGTGHSHFQIFLTEKLVPTAIPNIKRDGASNFMYSCRV